MSKPHKRRRRTVIGGPGLPHGAVRPLSGDYELPGNTSVFRDARGRAQSITIRGVVRDDVDIRRFAKALLDVVKRLRDENHDQAA